MIRRQVLSRVVALETADAGLAADLEHLVRDLPAAPAGAPVDLSYVVEHRADGCALRLGGAEVAGIPRDEILPAVMQELTARWVDRDDFVLVHGGVVVRGGRALVITGPSGRGKSTLTAALLEHGFRYFSDELAPIVAGGSVLRYPFPLRLRDGALDRVGARSSALQPWDRPARRWGEQLHFVFPGPEAITSEATAEVGMVVFPRRPSARGESPKLHALPQGTAAFRLMADVLNYAACPRAGFERALEIAGAVPCLELTHGELHETARLLARRWEGTQ